MNRLREWMLLWPLVFALNATSTHAFQEAADDPPEEEASTTIQVVKLKGAYRDHPTERGLNPLTLLTGNPQTVSSFVELTATLRELEKDDAIDGVLFDLSSPEISLNLAQLAELARRIEELKQSGKKTYAWIESAELSQYAVAASCDTILMATIGLIDLPSLALSVLHFRDAMDLLGVRASAVRAGDFKGAVEPFLLSEMSEHLREHYRQMVQSMNESLVDQLAKNRPLDPEQFREAQAVRLFTSKEAKEIGLVDRLAELGEGRQSLKELLGGDVTFIEQKKAARKQVSFFELMSQMLGGGQAKRARGPAIAVLHLEGQIVDGASPFPGAVTAGPTVEAIQTLAGDPNVLGMVVRIDSPGGSVTASESIRRALEAFDQKKPVVFSMGATAASGGYWITCIDSPVYAEAGTITGSIGVLALKFSAGPLLNRLGLNIQHVALDDAATAFAIDREWRPDEQERLERLIGEIYGEFLERVSEAREMDEAKISTLAGGRVWSGAQAKAFGLVDDIGGLDSAIARVVDESGAPDDYELLHRPEPLTLFEALDLFSAASHNSQGAPVSDAVAAAAWLGFDLTDLAAMIRLQFSRPVQLWLLQPDMLRIR